MTYQVLSSALRRRHGRNRTTRERRISVRSPLSLRETVKNLLIAVERRGMIVFARIDHAKAAEETASN